MLDPRHGIAIPILLLALVSTNPSTLTAQDVLLDTFQDDTVGQLPNGPEIGSYGVMIGTYSVIDVSGNQWLRSSSMAPTGAAMRWLVDGSPSGRIRLSYLLLVESGSNLSAINALGQDFRLETASGGGTGVGLEWGADMMWRIGTSSQPIGSFVFDRVYSVEWTIDTASDTYDLVIDGQGLVSGTVPNDPTVMSWMSTSANVATTASWHIDNVRATVVPWFEDDFESGDTSEWALTVPPAPTGDECTDARTLVDGTVLTGDLADNTGASGDDSSCGTGDTIDEWLEVTASCSGTLTVSTCHPGTEFDTVLAAYDTCGGAEIDCNDDDATGNDPLCDLNGLNRKSTVSFPAFGGQTYRIRVSPFLDGFANPGDTAYQVSAICNPI